MSGQPHFFEKHWPDWTSPIQKAAPAAVDPRIGASVEVVMCVRPHSQDVDQYVAVTLRNRSGEDIVLDGSGFLWKITDSKASKVQFVTDGLPGKPFWEHGYSPDRSVYECYVDPRGILSPGGTRTVGFVFFRKGLVRGTGRLSTITDLYLPTSEDQSTSVCVVLPEPVQFKAPGAESYTSRCATWRFNSMEQPTDIFATWEAETDHLAAEVDDRHARILAARIATRLGSSPPPHLAFHHEIGEDLDRLLREAEDDRTQLLA